MMILTKEIRRQLEANHAAGDVDVPPPLKLFTPWGAATWLIQDIDENNVMYGLCDIGHGCAELGSVWLDELLALRGPWGLKVERDRHFKATKNLSEYAADARAAGRITV
jgi:hypothetical protein